MVPIKSFADVQGEYATCDKKERVRNSHRVASGIVEVNRGAVRESPHPAAFPVDLPAYFLMSWPGDVYEPFSGSGTTLIACEQLSRRCRAVEIEPRYCDVSLRRWAAFTGRDPVREDGVTWSSLVGDDDDA